MRYVLIAALILVGALFYFSASRGTAIAEAPSAPPREEASPAKRASAPVAPKTVATERPTVRDLLPPREAILKDLEQDPHSTPASLMVFATDLAPRLTKALQDEATAEAFLSELRDCATTEGADRAARALCMRNAQRIAMRFPLLASRVDELVAETRGQLPE